MEIPWKFLPEATRSLRYPQSISIFVRANSSYLNKITPTPSMQRSILRIIAPTLLLWAGIAGGTRAQSLEQAKQLYNEGRYAEAKPLFEQLVNQSPANTSYNLWYGVCCYETGALDTAERYLTAAYRRPTPTATWPTSTRAPTASTRPPRCSAAKWRS